MKLHAVTILLAIAILLTGSRSGAVTYTYDELDRLTSATYDDGAKIVYTYDAPGNIGSITTTSGIMKGDINGNGSIDFMDAIMVMQVLSCHTPTEPIIRYADVDGDKKIGIPEAIFIIEKVAGLR